MDRRRFLGAAAVTPAAAYLASCSSNADVKPASATTPGSVPAGGADPAADSAVGVPAGQIDAAVAKLDELIKQGMQTSGVPGLSAAVVHGDKVVYAKGFGVKQVGTTVAVDEKTVFQLASVSKPVGATLVAALVGDGKLTWDDPIVKHTPDFALGDPYVTQHLTVSDMYAHRSGLPEHAGDLLEDLGYDRKYVLDHLRLEPLEPFRITYDYTNFGLTAGALAAAAAAGGVWEDLSRTRLYDQLGMTSTSSRFADFEAQANKALGNQETDGTWKPTTQQRQPDAQTPAGGVSSSAVDMANWMRMVLGSGTFEGKEVVQSAPLLEMFTPQMVLSPPKLLADRPSFYGLGSNLGVDEAGRVKFSHSGAFFLGTGTSYGMVPSEDLGIIVLTNGTPGGLSESIINTFLDVALLGAPSRDWLAIYGPAFKAMSANTSALAGKTPPNTKPAQAATVYTGSYTNDYFGPATVTATGDALTLHLGPKPMDFPLTHWDGDVFSYFPPGENNTGITAVTFAGGPPATSMTIENQNKSGLGVYTRSG